MGVTAKLFKNGRSQAVRLPKDCQFEGDEVIVQKVGDVVYLLPVKPRGQHMLESLGKFTPDFMADWEKERRRQRRRRS